MTTILAATGSTFDMGAGLTLTIGPRCKSTDRRNREERTMPNGQWGAYVAFSHCKRHGAEPIIADDLPPVPMVDPVERRAHDAALATAWTPERGWHNVTEPERAALQERIVATITRQ